MKSVRLKDAQYARVNMEISRFLAIKTTQAIGGGPVGDGAWLGTSLLMSSV